MCSDRARSAPRYRISVKICSLIAGHLDHRDIGGRAVDPGDRDADIPDQRHPAAEPSKMCAIIEAVVLFPLVPVTHTVVRSSRSANQRFNSDVTRVPAA